MSLNGSHNISKKTGSCKKKENYMVFFPSYKMMQQVYEVFQELDEGTVEIINSGAGMNEEKRDGISGLNFRQRGKKH